MKKISKLLGLLAALSMLLAACGPAKTIEQPEEITGSFTVTNDFVIATYMVEHAVALVDMHGFVVRDQEWEIPANSQVLGFMRVDTAKKSGVYQLDLPIHPHGVLNDVDQNGKANTGVQIFAVAYWPNLTGGPYAEGDDASRGWPSYLASVVTDSEQQDEVVGGSLVVWAPDNDQQFPTGFGADKKLFTADDPVARIPQGYTIVHLDMEPFTFERSKEASLELFEPKDVAEKDFSGLSYTEAFDKMFAIVRKEYAFNGIEGKQPDWDKLYAELQPRIAAAEAKGDDKAFYFAMRDFTLAFKDGHVGLGGGNGDQYYYDAFTEATRAGYGFAIRELDDGRVLVNYLDPNGPAAKAGMAVGAEITEFNGLPIKDAISAVTPWTLPDSSSFSIRYQQARYLLRVSTGTEAIVGFTNPDGVPQTVTLEAVVETGSFTRTSMYYGVDRNPMLPVEFKILGDGELKAGYVKVNSNYDDLNLIIRLFERALQTFKANKVAGIIIDMRHNPGGSPLGLAGFLSDKEIVMGQLQYYSDATGKFENEGLPEKVLPNKTQYSFDKMILLVAPTCTSACEIEAYGFSQVPGMVVMGQMPSGGVEAEVARGQFALPTGLSLQIPTGRFVLPDGSIFLEGQGVPLTVSVPVDETTIFRTDDVVLEYAREQITKPAGIGIEPSGPPAMAASQSEAESALQSAALLEDKAREKYETEELKPFTHTFTIQLNQDDTVIWGYGWCAGTKDILADNFKNITLKFVLDGQDVPADKLFTYDYEPSGMACRMVYTPLSNWPGGEHHLMITSVFGQTINDGTSDYEAGDYVYDYTVYVKP
jgi:C-terminal processing protease CtpA/Prc